MAEIQKGRLLARECMTNSGWHGRGVFVTQATVQVRELEHPPKTTGPPKGGSRARDANMYESMAGLGSP